MTLLSKEFCSYTSNWNNIRQRTLTNFAMKLFPMILAEDSSLRVFSTIIDLLNKSLGVASYNRKLSKKHKQIENPVKMEPIIGKGKT